jgi:hypothetical protein
MALLIFLLCPSAVATGTGPGGTFTDACFVTTAQIAEKLGLKTAPLQTVKTSIDKNLTQAKNSSNTSSMRVKNILDLETQLQASNTP